MRVLITNDDGIAAPGIRHLARAVYAAGHDVVVAAPDGEASGTSAALTAVVDEGRLLVDALRLAEAPHVAAYGVKASPAYIAVLAGLGVFGRRPDAVLSGINRGANAGHAILHSGTVGAALTAANDGMPALAVSLDVLAAGSAGSGGAALLAGDDATRNWASAADLAAGLLPWLATAPPGAVLNVNVPDRPPAAIRGLRAATLAPFGQVQMAVAEQGHGYVRTTIEEQAARLVPGSDVALLAEGFATMTAVVPPAEHPNPDIEGAAMFSWPRTGHPSREPTQGGLNMSTVTESIDVHVPVHTAYDQWTQFESFPQFMSGVEAIRQLDDRHTHWITKIGGVRREFDAVITEQHPDERIAWKSTDGPQHAGVVTFHRLGDQDTRVTVQLDWQPENMTEKVGSAIGADAMQVKADTKRFKEFIEHRGQATGAWRGDVPRPDTTMPGGAMPMPGPGTMPPNPGNMPGRHDLR